MKVITPERQHPSPYCREALIRIRIKAITSWSNKLQRRTKRLPPTSADATVSKFLDAVWMERGLSANTLAAYRADLTALARWLAERGTPIIKTTRADLLGFIAFRVEAGARPRSTARQLSSFRRFFRYFVREGVIKR